MSRWSRHSNFTMPEPGQGLEVNRIHKHLIVSRYCSKMSMFDRPNIAIEHDGNFKCVSIIKMARNANLKSTTISSTGKVNGRRRY
jgi:hypothetical protein